MRAAVEWSPVSEHIKEERTQKPEAGSSGSLAAPRSLSGAVAAVQPTASWSRLGCLGFGADRCCVVGHRGDGSLALGLRGKRLAEAGGSSRRLLACRSSWVTE